MATSVLNKCTYAMHVDVRVLMHMKMHLCPHPYKYALTYACTKFSGWLTTVGQQSGKVSQASRANHAIWHGRACCNQAIVHLERSGQSGT